MKTLRTIFLVFLVLIIVAAISRHFIEFESKTEEMIFTIMFTLIGIGYIRYSFEQKRKINKIILFISGVYLIAMNFIPEFNGITIIGIFATLIPLVIMKLTRKSCLKKSVN